MNVLPPDLPRINLSHIAPFSLVTNLFEGEMERNGISIDHLAEEAENRCEKVIPEFNNRYEQPLDSMHKSIIASHDKVKIPCSMLIESPGDLESHVLAAYQIGYMSACLAKKSDEHYPNSCGGAGIDFMLTALKLGYANSCLIYMGTKSEDQHIIGALPFTMKNSQTGIIAVDPTSEQLWKNKSPRNATFVVPTKDWTYETEWEIEKDLNPDRVYHLGDLRKCWTGAAQKMEHEDMMPAKKFFRKAYKNPLRLDICLQK